LREYSRLLFPVTTGSGIASGFLNCDTGLRRRINPGGVRGRLLKDSLLINSTSDFIQLLGVGQYAQL